MSAQETVQNPEVEQHQEEENEGAKVFIGNLAYSTTEDDVRSFLAPAGGEITKVELPMRGPRPAGFAFAFFSSDSEAKTAVEKLNGAELGDRQLTLDIAKPASQKRDELKAKRKAANEKRKAAKAAERAEQGETTEAAAPVEGDAEGAEKPKKKRAPRKKTPRRRQAGEEDGEEAEAVEGEAAVDGETPAARKPRQRKPRAESGRIDDAEASGEPRAPRAPKKRMLPTGEASKTSIFVANLPFSVDDDALAALFSELNIKVKTAHVVYARNFPKSTQRRSKGFGFVEVEDAGQQHEAVEKLDGKMIGERALTVKVANELKEVEQAADAAEGAEAAA